MAFDFEYFCQQNRIDYITHGVNVKSGEINICCPFCAETSNPDPSYHCGVDLDRSMFSCWRNSSHRGKKLHRLIMKMLRCSYVRAQEILGLPVWTTPPSLFKAFDGDFEALFETESEVKVELTFPKEFQSLGTGWKSEQPFVDYLVGRDFSKSDIKKLGQQYQLKWAVRGDFRNRLIFPNYCDDALVNWSARSIVNNPVKYRALSENEGAVVSIKKSVYQWDSLIAEPERVAVVVEGPIDALKLDYFGRKFGFRATCLFGKQPSFEQQSFIISLADVYDVVLLWLDDDAQDMAEQLVSRCEGLADLIIATVDVGIHDAGELTWRELRKWCKQQLEVLDGPEHVYSKRSRQRTNRDAESRMPRLWLQSGGY